MPAIYLRRIEASLIDFRAVEGRDDEVQTTSCTPPSARRAQYLPTCLTDTGQPDANACNIASIYGKGLVPVTFSM